MAIIDAKKRKIGRELVDWIFLGIRTGARVGVENYRRELAAGRVAEAEAQIKRAVDLPHRARVRIDTAIAAYNAKFGSGGQTFIGQCLTLAGSVTLAELNAELTTLENYAQGLVNHRLNDGWTWAQIADDIEANVEKEVDDWTFPLPQGYIDVWGE